MRFGSRLLRTLGVAGITAACVATPVVVPPAPQDAIAVSFATIAAAGRSTAGAPSGYSPADIASAYGLTGGGGGTVGIVTAYDAPNLEADLAVYRSQFGLTACTSANGCFHKVGQTGGSSLPTANTDWAIETSLDVEAVSAACPLCSITVVEANSAYISDLGTAVNTAASLGVQAISASWGSTESSGALYYATQYFTHPGIAIVAAAGDSGYHPATVPASLSTVVAVGGTTLQSQAGLQAARSSGGSHVLVSPHATDVPTAAQLKSARSALTKLLHTAAKQRRTVAQLARSVHAHPSASASHRLAVARAAARRAAARVTAARRTVRTMQHRIAAATPPSGGTTTDPITVAPTPVTTPTPAPTTTPTPTATPTPTDTATSTPTPTTTTTTFPTSRDGWTESAWSGGGSGCSGRIAKPAWQTDTMCSGRSVADIAADGDPATGLAVYDSYNTTAHSSTGWLLVGGTSLAAPLIAGMLVASGHAANYSDASPLYGHASAFWDVSTGSNGSCSGSAICTAGAGVDGPTGVGTPKSLASF